LTRLKLNWSAVARVIKASGSDPSLREVSGTALVSERNHAGRLA
jgi:hypothetical protein